MRVQGFIPFVNLRAPFRSLYSHDPIVSGFRLAQDLLCIEAAIRGLRALGFEHFVVFFARVCVCACVCVCVRAFVLIWA